MATVQTPMIGTWTVDVKGVRPFTIHGDQYHELHVTRVDGDVNELLAIRVPQHAFGEMPQVDQRLEMTFLMGQVTGVKKVG